MAMTMDVNMRWSMHEAVVLPVAAAGKVTVEVKPVPKATATKPVRKNPTATARPATPPQARVLVQMFDDGSVGWLSK